jgi:hypothetical protein
VYGCREVATLFESGRVATDAKPQAPASYQDPMGLAPPGIGSNESDDDDSALLAPSEWQEDWDD